MHIGLPGLYHRSPARTGSRCRRSVEAGEPMTKAARRLGGRRRTAVPAGSSDEGGLASASLRRDGNEPRYVMRTVSCREEVAAGEATAESGARETHGAGCNGAGISRRAIERRD